MPGPSGRKPLALHLHDKKKHLTEEDKKNRAESEITMGEIKFTAPDAVKNNKAAMEKWGEVTKIYLESGLMLVSSTDNGVIGRYCLMYADYLDLVEQRRIISGLEFPKEEAQDLSEMTEKLLTRKKAERLYTMILYFSSLDGVLKLDKAINAKSKSILDIEDRIYLNPASKVRTLPIKRKPVKIDPIKKLGFDV